MSRKRRLCNSKKRTGQWSVFVRSIKPNNPFLALINIVSVPFYSAAKEDGLLSHSYRFPYFTNLRCPCTREDSTLFVPIDLHIITKETGGPSLTGLTKGAISTKSTAMITMMGREL